MRAGVGTQTRTPVALGLFREVVGVGGPREGGLRANPTALEPGAPGWQTPLPLWLSTFPSCIMGLAGQTFRSYLSISEFFIVRGPGVLMACWSKMPASGGCVSVGKTGSHKVSKKGN